MWLRRDDVNSDDFVLITLFHDRSKYVVHCQPGEIHWSQSDPLSYDIGKHSRLI